MFMLINRVIEKAKSALNILQQWLKNLQFQIQLGKNLLLLKIQSLKNLLLLKVLSLKNLAIQRVKALFKKGN